MMRFRPEGFLPSRQRAAELSVHGLQVAEAEMGVEVATDNVDVAPHGQAELDRRRSCRRDSEDE